MSQSGETTLERQRRAVQSLTPVFREWAESSVEACRRSEVTAAFASRFLRPVSPSEKGEPHGKTMAVQAAATSTAAVAATGPGPEGILIGDRMYSGVLITLENCLMPEAHCAQTPSVSDGLGPEIESALRSVGCELIQSAGILLRMPQVAMATGQVLFQRFFYTKSFVKHSMEHVSMACVHLASKLEETPRRVRDVINVFHRLRQLREKRKPAPLILDPDYVSLKNQIIKAERRILKELGFCVHVKHPHKIIVMYLQVLECERNQHLVQTSWNYMNDSLRTDVFVRFPPETIACACIYLAARTLEIPLPNRPHWFLLFGASETDIQDICCHILRLYTRKKANLAYLESKVEKRKLAMEEAKAKAKGLLPDGTPCTENSSQFSPASKNDSPKEGKVYKASPLSVQAVKNARKKFDGAKRPRSCSPVNGVQKERESRSRSRDQSYSRSHSRSQSPKRRKSGSFSASSGSKSGSPSRSRSDSPAPRQLNHNSSSRSSKSHAYAKAKGYKYSGSKKRKSRSRSSSRSRSRSRDPSDHSGKYKKKGHYYRSHRRERSRSYERAGHPSYEREHSGHRHRR